MIDILILGYIVLGIFWVIVVVVIDIQNTRKLIIETIGNDPFTRYIKRKEFLNRINEYIGKN
jgi:hypothetical protein